MCLWVDGAQQPVVIFPLAGLSIRLCWCCLGRCFGHDRRCSCMGGVCGGLCNGVPAAACGWGPALAAAPSRRLQGKQ